MSNAKSQLKHLLRAVGLYEPARGIARALRRRAPSETSKCRADLAPFCVGVGLDIGYGGDPITPSAICMDLPQGYGQYGRSPQHIHGDARSLPWFADGALDFVYSSHVLEDFADTSAVLDEWLRVIRPGGLLVLFLPDEPTYREVCQRHGKPPNAHHVHANFGPDYLKQILDQRNDVAIRELRFPVAEYSFELVAEKIALKCP
jgi:SAM-dependent methyltransferase